MTEDRRKDTSEYYNDEFAEAGYDGADGEGLYYDEFPDDMEEDKESENMEFGDFDVDNYDLEDVAKEALKYLDSDPAAQLYGEDSYEDHINADGEYPAGDQPKGRKNRKKAKRSEKFKKSRNKKPRNRVHKKKHYFLKFLLICAIIAGIALFVTSSFFDVDKITVEGNSKYKAEQIIEMSGIKTGTNIFAAHTGKGTRSIEKDAYISDAEVKRVFPDKLKIIVKERTEDAYITYGKKFVVMNDKGSVLRIADEKPELTEIAGIDVTKAEEGSKVKVKQTDQFEDSLSIIEAMKKSEVYFKKVEVTKSTVGAYIYDELLCKGSVENVTKNIENGNLELILADLVEKDTKKGTITINGGKYCSFSPKVQ